MAKSHNNTGRSNKTTNKNFIQIHNAWFQHPSKAWLSLPHGAKWLWMILHSYNNGFNNGDIYLSIRHATKLLGCARASTDAWFKALESRGFIKKTKTGHLGIEGKGTATTWEMTHLGRGGQRPTQDYNKWSENKSPS
jgi:hypothetical protein